MFAYCGNNPLIYADPAGKSFAWIFGLNFNLFGRGAVLTLNLVSTEEDFGVQYSYYICDMTESPDNQDQTLGFDIGPYIGVQYTEKDNMAELTGPSTACGGDLLLGLDGLFTENGDYLRWQFGSSHLSFNVHSITTETETIISIPRLDVIGMLMDLILGDF